MCPPNEGQAKALRAFEDISTVVRLKRGDRLDIGLDRANLVYVVRSGSLILQTDLIRDHHIAIALYAPGCILKVSEMPPLRALAAVATSPCQILRTGEAAFERVTAQFADVRAHWMRELASQNARDKAHIVLLAGFSGEQRVASFFIDVAHRLGRQTGNTIAVDLPYSRSDIANYLALNPDTLSRIFSRLKSLGLIALSGRRNLEILDLAGLMQRTPGQVPLIEAPDKANVIAASSIP